MNSFGCRLRFPLIAPHCTIRKCYSQIPEQSPTVPNYPGDFSILHANGTIEAHLGEVQGRQWNTLTRPEERSQKGVEGDIDEWKPSWRLQIELTQVKLNQLVHMPCLASPASHHESQMRTPSGPRTISIWSAFMKCATPEHRAPVPHAFLPRWSGKSQIIVVPSGTIFYSCVSHKIVQLVTEMSSPAHCTCPRRCHLFSNPLGTTPSTHAAGAWWGWAWGWWQARFRLLFWHILMADVVRIVDFVDSISRWVCR